MADQQNVYWDANVFLHYVDGMAECLPVLDALLSSNEVTIYTSVMSIVEVSFGGVEQTGRLLGPAVEDLINGLWADPGVIVVECQAEIGEGAKRLLRGTFPRGWRLKPADAIHLATAKGLIDSGVQVAEFHTYDGASGKVFRHRGI